MGAAPPAGLRAVTFDFWNTLIRADDAGIRDRRLAAWLGLLAGEGIDLEGDVVRAAQRHASVRFEDHWRVNRFYGAQQAVHDMLEHLGSRSRRRSRRRSWPPSPTPIRPTTPSPRPTCARRSTACGRAA
ncbi:MAG: hypothetical protein R2711_00875 [Acidimicrobiales bacterium]